MISHEEANSYFIANEDGEEDVAKMSNDGDIDASSDDDCDLMDSDVALHCGEVTIDEDVMS